MNSSTTITKIAFALVKAQGEMGNALKGSENPFFKSKYADLNSIREAVLPVLNAHEISVIQPTCVIDGINYVETILLHSSGEYVSGFTQIIADKPNDAQKHGSGLSYARRYGLSAITGIGAEDDDANSISGKDIPENLVQIAIGNIRLCKTVEDLQSLKATLPESIIKDKSFVTVATARYNQLTKK